MVVRALFSKGAKHARLLRIAVSGVLAVVVASSAGRADEEKVPLDKLPKAIVAAVKKRFAEGEMVSAEKETDKGKTVYEVALKHKGKKIEVSLTPEGTILEIEKEIAFDDLPKAVSDTVKTKYPKADIKLAEEVDQSQRRRRKAGVLRNSPRQRGPENA